MGQMLELLDPRIAGAIAEQRARGAPEGSYAVLAFDTTTLAMVKVRCAEAFAPFRDARGRYFVAAVSTATAATLARSLGESVGARPGAFEGEVRRAAGAGRTAIVVHADKASAVIETEFVPLSPGGDA
ncbi:MAG TPA: hypothetical protein VFS43_00215 [Polyangiaceae bacterium]|nr:hypothetical protein [Polyangiaceae bacterium]